jgi:hypothetical protein
MTNHRNGLPEKEVGGLSRTTRTEPTDPNNTTSTLHSTDINSVNPRCCRCSRRLHAPLSIARCTGPVCHRAIRAVVSA